MNTYSANGVAAATAGSVAHETVFVLWNPDSLKRIYLLEFHVWRGGNNQSRAWLRRTTTRGTPGSTITPDADNAWDSNLAPGSGALLDLSSYTSEPTKASPEFLSIIFAAVTGGQGMGFVWSNPRGIMIPPGTGVGMTMPISTAGSAAEVSVVWEE